ncbi:IclR family transcriptional regulator C-terminal domain-containing protein [Phaeobacter sp. C3_T13_0]|uniref:IclR family transcriptional regulator domain-containing protein n=1 Tax=Phaeobacter cretensis TaxID=3342641 RepID=UPI0039BD41A5
MPRKAGTRLPLRQLADITGETAYVSVLFGTTLDALTSCESSRHGMRAIIDITTFPLHATASGLCALAFGPDELFASAATQLNKFTSNTAASPEALTELVGTARTTGFVCSDCSFEAEIYSLSAPLYDQACLFVGTVIIASVATRITPDQEQLIKTQLVSACREITRNWGGHIPHHIEAAWEASLQHYQSPSYESDTAS